MEIELSTYPYPLITEHFEGTVDEIVNQVRSRLEQVSKDSPSGEKLFGFHAISDVVISNVKK